MKKFLLFLLFLSVCSFGYSDITDVTGGSAPSDVTVWQVVADSNASETITSPTIDITISGSIESTVNIQVVSFSPDYLDNGPLLDLTITPEVSIGNNQIISGTSEIFYSQGSLFKDYNDSRNYNTQITNHGLYVMDPNIMGTYMRFNFEFKEVDTDLSASDSFAKPNKAYQRRDYYFIIKVINAL